VKRAAVIKQLKARQETISKPLAFLQSAEQTSSWRTSNGLESSIGWYVNVQTRDEAIEREVLASFHLAQSRDFTGDFRAWEHLLRSHARDEKVWSTIARREF
jgi:hypothetical protein